MRLNFELIGFDDAVFIRQTGIGGIFAVAPGTERIFVSRVERIFEKLKTVMHKHPGPSRRLVSVRVNQRYSEFRNEIALTYDYRDTFVTTLTHAGLFRIYTAIVLSSLRYSRHRY